MKLVRMADASNLCQVWSKDSKVQLLINNSDCILIQFNPYLYMMFLSSQDEYNLNPGLEWEDEFTGRWLFILALTEQHILTLL